MIPLFAPGQVRAMDRRAFARGVSSLALMERAAGHLTRAVVAAAGRAYGLRVAILCGKGNNGGDGLAAGRRLLDLGARPLACLVAGADGLSGDAGEQLRRYRAAGGRLAASVDAALAAADVGVDCLLGTGSAGEPRPPYGDAVTALNAWRARPAGGARRLVVACDLPTGVDADSGQVAGTAVRADLTVTLGAHKRGLHVWPARGHSGRIVLGELAIVTGEDRPVGVVLEDRDVAELLPTPAPERHKRSNGVVLAVAGSPGMSGAATLVARGAMAAGAGLVTVATSAAVQPLVAPSIPEALTVGLPDDPDRAFERLAGELERADVLALGPGLGHQPPAVALVRRLVAEAPVPVVLDADGLNAFRHDGGALSAHGGPLLVATPHAGELARLAGPDDPDVWDRRLRRVPELAGAWDTVIVAKGPGSIVAAPDGRLWANPTGGPALATGGTGDVLTGMAAALVAQRPDADAVAAAVYLHGLAGDAAGARRTVRSVTAVDVAAAVPDALRRLAAAA